MNWAAGELSRAGIESPEQDIALLLKWVLDCDALALWQRETLTESEELSFKEALERRRQREPLAFITGKQGFWTLDFEVSPATLIPRGDSEALIEALLDVRPERQAVRRLLDLGTGTGCLLLSALSEYKGATGLGVDIDPDAVLLAKRNAVLNGLEGRVDFMVSCWTEQVKGRFDVILSNPPYIEHDVIAGLMPEVTLYEPHRALDGGTDGLEAYRLLCALLPDYLEDTGCIIFELGQGQEEAVTEIAARHGLKKRLCKTDLGGITRALVLEKDKKHIGEQLQNW